MYGLSQSYSLAPNHPMSASPLEYMTSSVELMYAMANAPEQSLQNFTSPLERMILAPSYMTQESSYTTELSSYIGGGSIHREDNYHFIPDNFLKPGMHGTFVGKAEEVQEFVEDAFEKIFNTKFPTDIKVRILDEEAFRTIAPHPSTIGLSLNRRKLGLLSEVFVLEGSLARVLLTLGHELGHVLTPTLASMHNEEAKAFAFSFAWMDIIKEHNIANLKDAFIEERPAENGLHNIAYGLVQKAIAGGKRAWQVYLDVISGDLSHTAQ